ncbi:MAG: helix-turn-helix transcriptional regulator [Cyclobacteriaceae bacterium]
MINLFQDIKQGLNFNKFKLEELLFVEYTCPIPDEEIAIWTESDYIIHVLSGEKTWRTIDGVIHAAPGDTVYVRKGASLMRQYFYEDFCMLGFFVSNNFIKNTVNEVRGKMPLKAEEGTGDFYIGRISKTPLLHSYFQGMLPYFGSDQKPANSLLELKFKELFISLLNSEGNEPLVRYFLNLADEGEDSLPTIMERNFIFNLSLEQYAQLCHRSLSSFKRDFQKYYNSTPGKWLLSKRLDRAAMLLHDESTNVSRVAFESGFEDTAHFSRAFKEKFGDSPLNYRKSLSA